MFTTCFTFCNTKKSAFCLEDIFIYLFCNSKQNEWLFTWVALTGLYSQSLKSSETVRCVRVKHVTILFPEESVLYTNTGTRRKTKLIELNTLYNFLRYDEYLTRNHVNYVAFLYYAVFLLSCGIILQAI